MAKRWGILGFCLGLAACASYDGAGLRPGAGGDEIRAVMGEPGTVWPEADGGATWEYPRGPEGLQTFMVRLGPDGRLREIRQVLNAETFALVRPGKTTREEVRRLLGAPEKEVFFSRLGERVWSFRYFDPVRGYAHAFNVSFDERGIVTRTGSIVDDARFFQSGPDHN